MRVSEAWGEMIIMIKYYCSRLNSECVDSLTSAMSDVTDFCSCKMTHLHGYLSVEHWSLMSQRIKNFGEKPCQEAMVSTNLK